MNTKRSMKRSVKRSTKRNVERSTKRSTKRNAKRSVKRSNSRSGLCKQRLSEKIAININEGYDSRAQAIAVAYSQVQKMYPHCKQHLAKK